MKDVPKMTEEERELLVSKIMEVVVKALEENDAIEWGSPPISYNAQRDKLLRVRLTKLMQP